jgi:hypothetical protein
MTYILSGSIIAIAGAFLCWLVAQNPLIGIAVIVALFWYFR